MKEWLRKISSISMALIVVLSTLSFTVETHYCGDTLVDSSLFKTPDSCGMEMETPPKEEGCAVSKKDCCTDEQLLLEGQTELKSLSDHLTTAQEVFLISFVYTYLELFEVSEDNTSDYLAYRPPLVTHRIYKLVESYLI